MLGTRAIYHRPYGGAFSMTGRCSGVLPAYLVGIWLSSGGFAEEASPPPTPQESLPQRLAREARDSVVLVTVNGRDAQQLHLGAGFVVSADGLIATNAHVIGEGRPITVKLADERTFSATEVYAWDRRLDLAVIK